MSRQRLWQLDMPLIHLTVVEPTYYQSLQRMPAWNHHLWDNIKMFNEEANNSCYS